MHVHMCIRDERSGEFFFCCDLTVEPAAMNSSPSTSLVPFINVFPFVLVAFLPLPYQHYFLCILQITILQLFPILKQADSNRRKLTLTVSTESLHMILCFAPRGPPVYIWVAIQSSTVVT